LQRRLPQLVAVLMLTAGCAARTGSIGAVLGQSGADGRVTVRQAPPEHAAARAGIRAGDEILLIDGRDVRAMSPDAIHQALEGDVGSTVRLTLLRQGKIERISLTREPLAGKAPP
jgi:C-terminal processing protease CtpA/Prc